MVALGAAAFKALKASVDDAVKRFDTLNQFPKVLQSLGVSAIDSTRAMKGLSDGIEGLPTKLNDIASTAQRMYTSFGDMDKATNSAIALNNAMLGSGSSAADAQRGTEQYLQVLQKGKFDMQEWKTLQETMGVGLVKIAEGFGFAGASATNDLYKALQSGSITMDQFNDKLIEVGTGTGVMAKLAKENSKGIATSFENLKTSIAKGIANIIDSFNKLSKKATGKELADHIDSLKGVINTSFKIIGTVIEGTTPIVALFASTIKVTASVVSALTPVIAGLAAAYLAFKIISSVISWYDNLNKSMGFVTASTKLLELQLKKTTTAQLLKGTAVNADTIATVANSKVLSIKNTLLGLLTGQLTLSTVATVLKTKAVILLNGAMTALSGPIGWVVAGIGLLVAGAVVLVKWLNKTTEEGEKLTAKVGELGERTESLSGAVKDSTKTYKDNQTSIEANADANGILADKVANLSEKENKSAGEKKLLSQYVEELNGQVSGLNLSYDEEADKLNMSNEAMQGRIESMKEQALQQAAMERLTEILKEQAEAELGLAEINILREEWNQKLEDGTVNGREYRKAMSELDEQEVTLTETTAGLGEQAKITESAMTAAMENTANASNASTESMMIDFANLEGAQKEAFDIMSTKYEELSSNASDAFDRMSENSKVSGAEMIANLEHNQEMTANWGENVARLMERAGNEGNDGFLTWLDTMGPDSAAELAEVANMSGPELDRFIELMNEAPQVATDSFKTSLGGGMDEAVDQMAEHVNNLSSTTKQQMEAAGFDEIGKAVPEGLKTGIEAGAPAADGAAKDLGDGVANSARQSLGVQSPSTVFKAIGVNVADGLALGINQGTAKVVQAIQEMFKSVETNSKASFSNITKSYDSAIRTIEKSLLRLPEVTQAAMTSTTNKLNSGSTAQTSAFRNLAKSYDSEIKKIETSLNKLPPAVQKAMSDMLSKLKSGSTPQVATMKSLSKDLVSPFKNINSQFNSIGRNAMSGLNSGLNAGKGQVMSTARSIANSVASTMRNALKIHSPSRVMRDDIGKMIPEGIAVGIKDRAKSAYREIENLSSGLAKFSTPEMALGTHRMAYAGTSGVLNSTHKTEKHTTQNDNGTVVTGNTFVVRNDSDIEKIAVEINKLRIRKSRGLRGATT